MSVDSRFYDVAESWFRDTRSRRGYSKEEVNELAEQFQEMAEAFVADDEDEEEPADNGVPIVVSGIVTGYCGTCKRSVGESHICRSLYDPHAPRVRRIELARLKG